MITLWDDCPRCDGGGEVWENGFKTCPECKGTRIKPNSMGEDILFLMEYYLKTRTPKEKKDLGL